MSISKFKAISHKTFLPFTAIKKHNSKKNSYEHLRIMFTKNETLHYQQAIGKKRKNMEKRLHCMSDRLVSSNKISGKSTHKKENDVGERG